MWYAERRDRVRSQCSLVFCVVLSGGLVNVNTLFALNDTDTYVEMWIVMVIKTH